MSDAIAIGVLRDLAYFVGIATALGVVAYRFMRHYRPEVSWNQEGQVLSRAFSAPDLLVLGFIGTVFVGTMSAPEGDTADSPITAAALVISMTFNLVVTAALLVYLGRIRGLNPAQLFGLQSIDWPRLLKVVLIFSVLCIICVGVVAWLVNSWLQSIWPEMQAQDMVEAFQASTSWGLKGLVILAAVVVAPLAEEILFRGFVYGVLKRYTDAPFAAVASSLMFAIIHMHLGSVLPLTVLACLFCIAYEITGCLLASMLLHMIFNGTSILTMLLGAGQG